MSIKILATIKKCFLTSASISKSKYYDISNKLVFGEMKDAKATLLKKRLWHRSFPVTFVKFLRTPFLQNTSGRLLLKMKQRVLLLKNLSD